MREPLVDASLSETPIDGKCGGVQGRAVAKRQTPAGKWPRSGMSTVVPGAQRAPTPVAARMCGTRKPCRGPDRSVRQADREEGWIPRRAKDDREANTGGRKAAGNHRGGSVLQLIAVDNWPDTGSSARTRKRADAVR